MHWKKSLRYERRQDILIEFRHKIVRTARLAIHQAKTLGDVVRIPCRHLGPEHFVHLVVLAAGRAAFYWAALRVYTRVTKVNVVIGSRGEVQRRIHRAGYAGLIDTLLHCDGQVRRCPSKTAFTWNGFP